MCIGGDDEQTQTTSSTSTVTLPPWITAAAQRALAEAEQLGNRAYTPYTGTRIAGFTSPELAAQGRLLALSRANVGGAELKAATAATQGAAQYRPQTIPEMDLQAYMNPYLQNVSDRAMADIGRQQTLQQQQLAAQAKAAGAFGGSRFGVVEAESARNYADIYANQMANMYANAYQSATGLATGDIQRGLEGQRLNLTAAEQLANLGLTGRRMREADAMLASQVGEAQRKLKQAGLDIKYQNFLEKRDWPERGLALRLSALGAVPYGSTTSGTQTGTMGGGGGNPWLGAAGGALTGAQLGSVVPGIGTGVGAIVGGLSGGLC